MAVEQETINKFLNGRDEEKYIVNIESSYGRNDIFLIKHYPDGNKEIKREELVPFAFVKDLTQFGFFKGNKSLMNQEASKIGLKGKLLRTENDKGFAHPRLDNGFKYVLHATKGTTIDLINYFGRGGLRYKDNKDKIIILQPTEQYLIQSGKRLFKGYEEYNDIERLVFDIETTGLEYETCEIFQIGVKNNKGYERIISVQPGDKQSELDAIEEFFNVIHATNPAIIHGYNSENFDFTFIMGRLGILVDWYNEEHGSQLKPEDFIKDLSEYRKDVNSNLSRRESTIKYGAETENYQKTTMWGYSIIDTYHAVRRAQAINSGIKKAGLKYICQYSKINKPNRVYVPGGDIGTIWADTEPYYFSDIKGAFSKSKSQIIFDDNITTETICEHLVKNSNTLFVFDDNVKRCGKNGLSKLLRDKDYAVGIATSWSSDIDGDFYFTDDKFEEIKDIIDKDIYRLYVYIDKGYDLIFPKKGIGSGLSDLPNKAPKVYEYLISKLKGLRTYIKTFETTTGRYIIERYLIDDLWETEQVEEQFNQANFLTSKILPTNYERVCTMGTAAIWKLLMIAWSYENELAIPEGTQQTKFTGGLSKLILSGRIGIMAKLDFASLYPSIQLTHDVFPEVDIMGAMKGMLIYNYEQRNKYKALKGEAKANGDAKMESLYDKKQLPLKILNNSMFGSLSAPNIFYWGDMEQAEKITCTGRQYLRNLLKFFMYKGLDPVVMDTDGVNFTIPDEVNDIEYIGKGNHRFTKKDKLYKGLDAVVAEYNDLYMLDYMGLDIDEVCESSINIARKNYANKIDGKIKLVGNTIKSKALPTYIEEFIDNNIMLLLDDKGDEFLENYYAYVEEIYNMNIPLAKIANKSKVKITKPGYEIRCKETNKNGGKLPRMAYMELMIRDEINAELGDTVYYINDGSRKSHPDIKVVKDKEGNESVEFNCYMIPKDQIENNPNLKGKYNVPKYLDKFNTRIKPLLVCFHPDIRDNVLVNDPEKRNFFTKEQAKLVSGYPISQNKQDKIEDVLLLEETEVKFWDTYGLDCKYMFEHVKDIYNLEKKV